MPAPVEAVADGEDDEDWLAEVVVEPVAAADPPEVEAELVPKLVLDMLMVVDAELMTGEVKEAGMLLLFPDADGAPVDAATPDDALGITRVTPAALQVEIAKALTSGIWVRQPLITYPETYELVHLQSRPLQRHSQEQEPKTSNCKDI